MTIEQIHDTSRLDAWLSAQRERESAWSQAHVYQARAESHRQMWKPMLAGAAGAAIVVAAVWVAMPKFMPRQIEIPVVNVTRNDVEVPNIVKREVTIDVPNIVRRDITIDASKTADPSAAPGTAALPTKIATAAEMDFINQPAYQTTVYHGRIVGKNGKGFRFDNNKTIVPFKTVNGKGVVDHDEEFIVQPFIGDYAYCNKTYTEGVFNCRVIHNGVDQRIPGQRVAPYSASADPPTTVADNPAVNPPAPSFTAPSSSQPPTALKKIRDCVRAPMSGSCAH